LVKAVKETVSIPVQLHSHYTSGLASMVHLKGVEAGVDLLDTAISPLALGTSHPATESMVAALKGTEYDTGLDIKALTEIREFFYPLREKYIASGLLNPKMLGVDANTLLYQVPGGMLSNLVSQLKQAGKEDKLEEVLHEVPRVRKDAGYPPLVTPTSQIVGTQSVFNIILGERYKMVTKEFKDLVAGKYGKTPCDIDPEFQKRIVGDDDIISCRPADRITDKIEDYKNDILEFYEQEEDILSYAQFGQVAVKFFEKRRDKKYNLDGRHDDIARQIHPV
jgi:oxaloacetate decarboxylase alpha subunit